VRLSSYPVVRLSGVPRTDEEAVTRLKKTIQFTATAELHRAATAQIRRNGRIFRMVLVCISLCAMWASFFSFRDLPFSAWEYEINTPPK